MPATFEVSGFLTFTLAIVVYFIGAGLNGVIAPLRRWNIPEAVTGGLLAAVVTLLCYRVLGLAISFDLAARDMLLLYFFTGIGLNARVSDLALGGRPLLILLGLTVVYLGLQNAVAIGGTKALGLPDGLAPLLGSVSLIGGHGTTIAWAPAISERFGLPNALEVGIASATLGLVIASLVGGPVAGILISRFKLRSDEILAPMVGLPDDDVGPDAGKVTYRNILSALLVLNVVILTAYSLEGLVEKTGIKLPLFVVCLLVAIVLTNTLPHAMPRMAWPARTPALALISDLSLKIFLAMSLMSMQLWTLGGLGPALAVVLGLQTLVAVLYILFVVFPAMGRDYQAAVLAAGFTGISLGATPTAIANMTAVTRTHGPAPIAFIILPLVSAFFIDIANALAIGFMLR
ncbi:UNVERIFIED_ORG: ESS family glutamate:Na+ symporter [Xanthobacter viscosus]|jgi:ESS family glutamate:Na+ symporter|uniref:Sodium/glutamate symporter n=1 Tax=Xanthobacter autotrophicus TaxID=280 RepID=A0A6C1K963_XANAU|nr:sodium/glutamate symporter [Xanthobacter autotrophicus]TLX40732.1 sodium/glutamate symporter [Xanthobacter autotrophicus]